MAGEELVHRIEQTAAVIDQTLQQLDPLRMEQEFPLPVLAQKTTVAFMLVHLATHLGYHLGQVNYHRRPLDKTPANG